MGPFCDPFSHFYYHYLWPLLYYGMLSSTDSRLPHINKTKHFLSMADSLKRITISYKTVQLMLWGLVKEFIT